MWETVATRRHADSTTHSHFALQGLDCDDFLSVQSGPAAFDTPVCGMHALLSHSHFRLLNVAFTAGIESDIPGTTEHRVKKDEERVEKDDEALGNEERKNDMSEGDKLKSDIPFTSEHRDTHE